MGERGREIKIKREWEEREGRDKEIRQLRGKKEERKRGEVVK